MVNFYFFAGKNIYIYIFINKLNCSITLLCDVFESLSEILESYLFPISSTVCLIQVNFVVSEVLDHCEPLEDSLTFIFIQMPLKLVKVLK